MYLQRQSRHHRAGNIVTLSLFLMVGMLGILAFAIDLGYLHVARTELQRTADAAAMAATWELVDQNAVSGTPTGNYVLAANARKKAEEFAALNIVLRESPNLSDDDVEVGYLSNPSDPNSAMDKSGTLPPNAVRVRVRRAASQNGEVPLFFARVLGLNSVASEAEATAALLNDIRGFQTPSDGSNLGILPFALDEETWLDLLAGNGTDNWSWNADTGQITGGPDEVLETNLYPQATGSPGNRGTVDIGSSNNSTNDLRRQIEYGLTPEDLAYHGGSLEFDESGQLFLGADPGISAGVKDSLETIKGAGKIIPIFRDVSGNGNNAQYTIVAWVGVRVLDVNLTGKNTSKRVIIQPANVIIPKGAIAAGDPSGGDDGDGDDETTSHFLYSPAWLVR